MPRCPHPRGIDATASTVRQHAVDHQVQIIFPIVNAVVAQNNLAVSGAVDLHGGVALILFDRALATKNHAAVTFGEDCRPHIRTFSRVDRNCFGWNSRLAKGREHPIRRPRFKRARFEDEADLQRDDRQPERVYSWRIRWQNEAERVGLCLVADDHPAPFIPITAPQYLEIETPRECLEDTLHIFEHEAILLHVAPAHVFGKPRGCRLCPGKISRSLHPISHRQRGGTEKCRRLADACDEITRRKIRKNVSRRLRFSDIAPDDSGTGLRDNCDGLPADEMPDLSLLERFVRFSPANGRYFKHLFKKCVSFACVAKRVGGGLVHSHRR